MCGDACVDACAPQAAPFMYFGREVAVSNRRVVVDYALPQVGSYALPAPMCMHADEICEENDIGNL